MKINMPDEILIKAAKRVVSTPELYKELSGKEYSFLGSLVRSWEFGDAKGKQIPPHQKKTAYSMLEAHDWLDYND